MAGIYIHIPYCKQKCIYCDFYFRTNQSDKLMLLKCINQEIKIRKDYLFGEQVSSIYFGGGTPSIISVKEINSIIKTIYYNFEVCENIEITLECNPDDLNLKYLNDLVTSKVNRLSIGVQSFNNNDLRLLKSSGNIRFDNSAMQAVRRVETFSIFKEMPEEVYKNTFKSIIFRFNPAT